MLERAAKWTERHTERVTGVSSPKPSVRGIYDSRQSPLTSCGRPVRDTRVVVAGEGEGRKKCEKRRVKGFESLEKNSVTTRPRNGIGEPGRPKV